MAIAIITLLIAATLELNRKVTLSVMATAAERNRHTLTHIALSGINTAMAMLIKDKMETRIDSIQEDWANPEKIAEVLQDITFEKGNVTFTISDELGKIQINSLVRFPESRQFNESQKIMWDRFIRTIKEGNEELEDIEVTMIINSLKDWLDSGDDDAITGLNGAESDYYESLDPPYSPANGPFTHLGELALVRGITPELFDSLGRTEGLSRYMTIYGMAQISKDRYTWPGMVNINTADLPVLAAIIPSENPEYAQEIYSYRNEKEGDNYIHDLSSPTWYKNAPGCSELIIDPNIIMTISDYFQIEATAALDDMKLTITTIVFREKDKKTGKWKCRVLRWERK